MHKRPRNDMTTYNRYDEDARYHTRSDDRETPKQSRHEQYGWESPPPRSEPNRHDRADRDVRPPYHGHRDHNVDVLKYIRPILAMSDMTFDTLKSIFHRSITSEEFATALDGFWASPGKVLDVVIPRLLTANQATELLDLISSLLHKSDDYERESFDAFEHALAPYVLDPWFMRPKSKYGYLSRSKIYPYTVGYASRYYKEDGLRSSFAKRVFDDERDERDERQHQHSEDYKEDVKEK